MVRSLEWPADNVLYYRTVAAIQGRVVKQSKRNGVSRLFHAKNDKEKIAAWKSDINRILHVFNVRSVTFVWPPLIVHFQTELSMNTHTVVSDIRRDVAVTRATTTDAHATITDTHTTVTGTHATVMDTHTIVSDIHRAIVETQERTSVSVTCIPFIGESMFTFA